MDDHPEHPVIHDGIFLGYDKNIPLKNEGLGRLLAFVVSGWVQLPNHRLTIACPYWLVKDLQSLLADHGIPDSSYDLLRTKDPWWRTVQLRLKAFERSIRPTVHRYRAWLRGDAIPEHRPIKQHWLERIVTVDFSKLLHSRKWTSVTFEAFKLVAFAAIVFWLLRFIWPAILVLLIVFGIYRLWRKYKKKKSPSQSINPKRSMRKQKRRGRRYAREISRLIKQVNQQQLVNHWLVPTPFWPEANRIAHTKAIVCPDLVLQQFPLRFADPSAEAIYARILTTLQHADRLICYSDFIRTHQLVHGVGLAPEQIQVIGHGQVDLAEHLKLGKSPPSQPEQKQIALEFLRSYQRASLARNPYWSRYSWDRGAYVFYSSQARGQKNILSLLRAIEILRHRPIEPIRLVLTCQRSPGSDIDLFVSQYRLDPWVLFANDVSNQVLASLYCWAAVAVNPTLFEGGFPFTFTEAFSVGTPSLLSDIPMVKEKVQDPNLIQRMIFDPLDPQDIASKTQWAVEHPEELLAMEKELFDSFPTWQSVALSYSNSLRSFGIDRSTGIDPVR